MRNDNITRLTLAGMFAALAFVCFTYLRIEIPMGGGYDRQNLYRSCFLSSCLL